MSALLDAAGSLATGFHVYHLRDKTTAYNAARQALCVASCHLRLLSPQGDGQAAASRIAAALEAEVIPAVGGLVRTMEQKAKKRPVKEEQHGQQEQ